MTLLLTLNPKQWGESDDPIAALIRDVAGRRRRVYGAVTARRKRDKVEAQRGIATEIKERLQDRIDPKFISALVDAARSVIVAEQDRLHAATVRLQREINAAVEAVRLRKVRQFEEEEELLAFLMGLDG